MTRFPYQAAPYRRGGVGYVHTWTVSVIGDTITACPDGCAGLDCPMLEVEGLGRFVASVAPIAVGWGQLPDGAEVFFLYDETDDCIGYAFNVTAPQCSEWGYAPFPRAA